MPNQKSVKGRKNKRTNSSGDEQEAAAGAAACNAGAGTAAPGASGATAGQPETGNDHEAPCATPLVCGLGRAVQLDKDDHQRVVCNNEQCPFGNWMHLQCFYEWESSILVQFNCIGRARSWNEKQCRQNMWNKKGYDLAFRFCSCRCGQGHLRKDVDWFQSRRRADDRKKKPAVPKAGEGTLAAAVAEDGKKCKLHRPARPPHEGSGPGQQRRLSADRQALAQDKAPAGSSPPQPSQAQAPTPRGPRHLGDFLKTALQAEACRKLLPGGPRLAQVELGPAGAGAVVAGGAGGGRLEPAVQFLRRLDLSELLAHVPKHKMNTYHVRMEDDAQAGQGEDLRRFILAALSASQRNVVHCALCHRALPVFELFPLVDGTLFLSPSRHDEIEYDVPCHLQGRLMHLYAICVDCLEGVHKIICIKCKSRWDGSWHQLGTMYTYDILAASPCCQARLNCKHCGKPVIDVRVGMQYFSEYSNVQQCPHCGNLDYHFVKPFSSFKVLEAY
ncbi:headcase protein homolog [Mobula hypostoma]|uniref:headcase protein homolog n=1 Tax=Mobula hypostoma TaxID=723540 RepID=UPI002FC2D138